MSRTWAQLVAEGRQLVSMEGDIKWQLGDLALEVAPMGARGIDSGATEKLERFAEEIGVSFDVLREYRRVAAAWPNAKRLAFASWSVHGILASRPDRFDFIKTLPIDERGKIKAIDAQRAVGQKVPASNTNLSSAPEQRAAAVKEYLEDPAVRRQLVRDDNVRADWSRSAREEDARTAARVARQVREDAPRLVEAREFYEAQARILHARQDVRQAVELLAGLPPLSEVERDDLGRALELLVAGIDHLQAFTKARRSASLADEVHEFLAANQ
jgi:hypothetical protein